MANEIRAQGSLQITKDGFTITGNSTQTLSITGSQYEGTIVSVGATFEALPLGDLSDFRYIYLLNQSTSSISCSLSTANSGSFAALRPDDVLVLPPPLAYTTYYVKADQAGADLQFVATET